MAGWMGKSNYNCTSINDPTCGACAAPGDMLLFGTLLHWCFPPQKHDQNRTCAVETTGHNI